MAATTLTGVGWGIGISQCCLLLRKAFLRRQSFGLWRFGCVPCCSVRVYSHGSGILPDQSLVGESYGALE